MNNSLLMWMLAFYYLCAISTWACDCVCVCVVCVWCVSMCGKVHKAQSLINSAWKQLFEKVFHFDTFAIVFCYFHVHTILLGWLLLFAVRLLIRNLCILEFHMNFNAWMNGLFHSMCNGKTQYIMFHVLGGEGGRADGGGVYVCGCV